MSKKSIDQNIFPEVLGTARCVLLPEVTLKLRYMPLEIALGLFISPQDCIDIPKHSSSITHDLHMQISLVLLTGQ